ncbi:uncharacterized protein LOC113291812 [Papaver somniferum]|uniref:uncharacterized protein LOC113291812 n=1 Tax=Papaver somniferum TaxID=3469 RepID=UPI000E6FA0CE|nr:uncharacterized protein LOC113291812 [Papaver somniferum]
MVSKICDAPTLDDPSLRGDASAINPNLQFTIGSLGARLSYIISLDYQRRLIKLEKENAKLKDDNSTNYDLIRRARERNDELIDLVLNDARKDLSINVSLQDEHSALVKDIVSNYEDKEKNYLQKIEELKTHLASEEKDLSARNSKYQQLKKNFTIMVSNNSNDANRARESAVKKVCIENNIPPTKYKFPEIPDNENIYDISDSEGEDEESEEEISGSEAERDEEDED